MAVKQWSVGDVLAAADMNLWTVPIAIIKPSDTTRVGNTSTAFADDPDLVIPVAANAVYSVAGMVYYDGPSNADMKFTWTIPAGTTGYWTPARQQPGGTFVGMYATVWTDTGLAANTTGVGTIMTITAQGLVDTAGTAGNLTFRWAPNTANAGNNHVKAQSYIVAQRIG